MDDETLDWEHDTESQSGTNIMSVSNGVYPSPSGRRDVDVEEDAISLGEDDDDQYFYQREEVNMSVNEVVSSKTSAEKPPSIREREDTAGANDSYSRHSHRARDRYEDSKSRPARSPHGSPQRYSNHHSRNHTSPPQTRVTHALPPKPVTAAPYIPPSAIVAATSMTTTSPRAGSRDGKRANGNPHGRSPSPISHPEGPPYRESRRARSGSHERYYGTQGQESTWNNPVSSIPSSSRRHSSSQRSDTRTAGRTPKSSDSDTYHSQASRNPHRDREPPHGAKHQQNEHPLPPSDLPEPERHYRPSGAPHTAPRQAELGDMSRGRFPARSGYVRPSSLSPPRVHRRGRSVSPRPTNDVRPPAHYREDARPSHRGNPRPRDRDTFTNLDGAAGGEMRPVNGRNAWSNADSARVSDPDFGGRSGRETRNTAGRPRSPIFDKMVIDPDLRHRSPRRSDAARGPPRDREPNRRPESRERERAVLHQDYSSAPRTFPREDRAREYAPYRDDMQTFTPPAPHPPRERQEKPRFERSASNGAPYHPTSMDRQPFVARMPEYEVRQSTYDSRRPDNQYDHGHRGNLPQNLPREQSREQSSYGVETSRMVDTRHEHRIQYNPPLGQDELPPSTHRRRNPLPPQANIFTTVGNGAHRDLPPHVPVQSFQPTSSVSNGRFRHSDMPAQNDSFDEPPLKHVPGRLKSESSSSLRRNDGMIVDQRRLGTEDRALHFGRDADEYSRTERLATLPPPSERDDRRSHHQDSGHRSNYSQPPLPRVDTRMQQAGLPFDDYRSRRPPSPRGEARIQQTSPLIDPIRTRRPSSPIHRAHRPIFSGHGPEVPTGPRFGRLEPPLSKSTPANPPPKPPAIKPSPTVPTAPSLGRSMARPLSDNGASDMTPVSRASERREDNGYAQRGSRRESKRPAEDAAQVVPPPPLRPAASGPNSVPINHTRRMPSAGSSTSGVAIPSAASLLPPPASLPVSVVHPLPVVPPPMFNPGAMPPASTLINPAKARKMEGKKEAIPFDNTHDRSSETSTVSIPTEGFAGLVIMTRPETASTEIRRKASRFSASKETHDKEPGSPLERPSQTQPAPTIARQDSQTSRALQETPVHSSLPSKPAEPIENKLEGGSTGRQSRFGDKQPDPDQPSSSTSAKFKEDKEVTLQTSSWSARMMESGDKPALPRRHESARGLDDLSSRLSDEKAKPPRHRKLERRHGGDGSISFPSAPPPEEPLSFQNRADKPPTLLQRLSFDDNSKRIPPSLEAPSPSLRDRIVPAKRDHDDVDGGDRDVSYDADEGNDNKRARRKSVKNKRGRR